MSFLSNLFSGQTDPLKTYSKELDEVNGYQEEVAKLSQEQIQTEIRDFKSKIKDLKTDPEVFDYLDEIAPRVFALTREASKRSIGQFHYDVQVVGGFALADRKIAEMSTGEGKTLTATLPLAFIRFGRPRRPFGNR